MSPILILAAKDLKLLVRDRAGLFWVLFFPLVMALFFGAVMGGQGGDDAPRLMVALVDEDGSDASRSFAARLEASSALAVRRASRDEATAAVRRGKLTALVVLPAGYGKNGGLPWGDTPAIQVGIDPVRQAERGYLEGVLARESFAVLGGEPAQVQAAVRRSLESLRQAPAGEVAGGEQIGALLESFDAYLGSAAAAPGADGAGGGGAAMQGPRIEVFAVAGERIGPRSAFEISFPQAMVWALIGTAAAFAIAIVKERVDGTFMRLRLAPLERYHLLGGKGLACMLASSTTVLLLAAVGRLILGVRIVNPLAFALAVGAAAACFTGLMMLVSTIGKSEQAVAGAGWGIFLVMAMLGGGMVPLFVMPGWMRTLSSVSPVKWAVLGFEGAIWRGFGLTEMSLPLAILAAVGVLGFALGVRNLNRLEG